MNVVFTCGGTGGHINPALAVANIWKEHHPTGKILFIGGVGGMEEKLVPKAGYELITLPANGMERGKSPRAMLGNTKTAFEAFVAIEKCKKILKDFHADVVMGTGGYASFPALMAASILKIPTCVHESNAVPGLTTRLVADFVDKVLVCFPESAKYYKHPEKVEVVGMPVRREFIYTRKADARRELGLDERPLIVTAFGSQGAMEMNKVTGKMMKIEQEAGFPYQHIHAVGSYGWSWMPDYVKDLGVEKNPSIRMEQYIYNMPTVMAAADVVIGRAGASTCNEIAASGTPCILIPSPNVTDNHQEKNARALEENGAAVVVLEKDCTADRLWGQVRTLLRDEKKYQDMAKALHGMAVPDSAERLCRIMDDLTYKKS